MTQRILTNGFNQEAQPSNGSDSTENQPLETRETPNAEQGDASWKRLFLRLTAELDFVEASTGLPELHVETKEVVIRAMVARLASAAVFPSDEEDLIVAAILRREELATTGIGRGIAIPHTKHPTVRRLVATVAHLPAGIDFGSQDGAPVHVIILLLSPVGQSREHLVALEGVSRILQ